MRGIDRFFHFKIILIFAALLLLVVGTSRSVSAKQPVILEQGGGHYPLGLHLEYVEDAQRKWTIEDVASTGFKGRFVRNETETVSYGYSRSVWWFRFELQSRFKEKRNWLLEVAYPLLDRIELFLERPEGVFTRQIAGESFPFSQRGNNHRNFVFAFESLPGQSQRIYLKIDTESSVQVPLVLWSPEAFVEKESNALIALGIFNGLLLVMVLYNLFLFIAIRDKNYLYYVLFVLFVQIMLGSFDGLPQKHLWPAFPWWANRAVPFSIVFAGIWLVLFTRDFLDVKLHLPRWNKALSVMAVLCAIASVLTLVLSYRTAIKMVSFYAIFVPLISVVVGVLSWRKGVRPARYFLLGWTVLLIGCAALSSTKLGVLPRTFLTEYGAHFGLALNVILLSFALADRINIIREEKEQAQKEAFQVQKNAAETLEQEVQNRTQELKQAYDRLSEQDQLKSRFFANVSHELRTPLTLILTPLERLLARDVAKDPEAAKQQLRSMAGNTHRLLRLVNQLLDFSRLESGAATVAFELRNIQDMVASMIPGFIPFARSKGLKLELRGPDELPEVYVDSGKLEKIISNLLSNACKFTEPGGTVLVKLSSDDDSVKIAIKDTGIGIAEEDLPKIFERFRQVDGSASRQYEGTGIGLALSKELIDLIGGKLVVQSDLGVGSTFTVCLPLGKEHIKNPALIRSESSEVAGLDEVAHARASATALATEVGLREQAARAAEPQASTGGEGDDRPLVVVVEDNPDMRALVSEICQQDFRVLEAKDGQEGLELVKERRPALVISDIMMPRIDGYELLGRLRSDPATASIPVILLTAKAGPEMKLEGLESGADDYLTKPFDSRELLARAHNLVRLQQQERELRELNANLQQQVVRQSSNLERARMLERYLPPGVARHVLEGKEPLGVSQDRRRLTVFRLELRGFDDMLEMVEPIVEPEDMATMLNTYLSEMVEVAFAHGATLDKFMRDTLVGFFGAPTSEGPEQDAQRCARMAIAMWQRAIEVCARWRDLLEGDHPPIPTMVLASGSAAVGNFGSTRRLEYTAVGGPLDEAAYLLEEVGPGEVCCSQTTWVLIQGEVAGELCNTVTARHRVRPVKLYRIAGPPEWVASMPTQTKLPTLDEGVSPQSSSRSSESTPSESATGKLRKGTVLSNRYEILETLGKGGMGMVYQTRDIKLDAVVALKLIRDEADGDPTRQERLYREVKLARLVSHPSVARIYDLGEWQGRDYITMEYIHGDTLGQRLKDSGALSIAEGQRVLLQLCAGLGAAHAAGIVHRDLKPSNIMLASDGRVVILDFGIARWTSALHRAGGGTHGPIGTPSYMAPEQFESGDVDHRADIYSLGVVAFALFTGHKPFQGDSMAKLVRLHTLEPPPDPLQLKPDLPPRLAAVILQCLEKSPQDRFSSVMEIASLLESVAVEEGAAEKRAATESTQSYLPPSR